MAVELWDTRSAVALVDFSNVLPRQRSDHDVSDALEVVALLLRSVLSSAAPARGIWDVECRLYDGWLDRRGDPTERHTRVRRLQQEIHGLKDAVRIRPQLVTSLACMAGSHILGTYKNGGQKMVDQMIAQDAAFFAYERPQLPILVVGDDDDYIPVLLAMAVRTQSSLRWIRRRSFSENDHHFEGLGVEVIGSGDW